VPPSTTESPVNAAGFASGSGNVTTNTTGVSANAGDCGATVGTGSVVSNAPDRVAAAFGLPEESLTVPAGTVTVNAPSAVRLRVRWNVVPPSEVNPLTATGPVTWRSDALNVGTGSEKTIVTGMLAALVGSG